MVSSTGATPNHIREGPIAIWRPPGLERPAPGKSPPVEDEEVVQTEFELPFEAKSPAGPLEHLWDVGNGHSVMLVDLHAIEEMEAHQDVEDRVDRGRRNCGEEYAGFRGAIDEGSTEREQLVVVEVLEDGKNRTAVESAEVIGQIIDESGDQSVAPGQRHRGCIRIDTDARGDPGPKEGEEGAIVAADIEHTSTDRNMPGCLPESQLLNHAVE